MKTLEIIDMLQKLPILEVCIFDGNHPPKQISNVYLFRGEHCVDINDGKPILNYESGLFIALNNPADFDIDHFQYELIDFIETPNYTYRL